MARTTRKPATPKTGRRLVVFAAPAAGEDLSIYECDTLDPYNADQLARGILRLFDPARDDRGPEVPFIATWGMKPSTWHPKTSGTYIVTWTKDAPEEVRKGWSLGMGSCSAPQHRRAGIARVWADMQKNPKLAGHLRILKVPCVMRMDATEAPGGSWVEIDPATLPAPLPESHIDRTYG